MFNPCSQLSTFHPPLPHTFCDRAVLFLPLQSFLVGAALQASPLSLHTPHHSTHRHRILPSLICSSQKAQPCPQRAEQGRSIKAQRAGWLNQGLNMQSIAINPQQACAKPFPTPHPPFPHLILAVQTRPQ
eukprot:1159238-Pelagomonas_calceolata.AAC.5